MIGRWSGAWRDKTQQSPRNRSRISEVKNISYTNELLRSEVTTTIFYVLRAYTAFSHYAPTVCALDGE